MKHMNTSIGKSLPRIDARDKVTGAARYSGDLVRPGMLHMKTLFAGRPHARVISIDTTQALAFPGVIAIFTAADVPVNEYGLQWKDQPVLCGPVYHPPISPVPAALAQARTEMGEPGRVRPDIVRCEGDQVAVIVAETEAIAAKARDLVQVEYEDLPAVYDAAEALTPAAPQGRRGIRLCPGGCHCRRRIPYTLPGTRLSPAGGRVGLPG
jgi:CO/xanthine dehydrogenase Mo-binding subunit